MAPARRPSPQSQPAANLAQGPSFLDLGFYSGGFQLPAGYYALSFESAIHQPTNRQTGQTVGAARLGIMVTAYPILDGGFGDAIDPPTFLSMGSKAMDSFAPNPDNPKELMQVPNPAGSGLNNKTNWFIFLKSLYDCGMPPATNDLSVLDGMWVHTDLVEEPEDRKGFGAQTGEAAVEQQFRSGKTIVVTEFLDGGKPWEGGGGLPEVAAPAPPPAPIRPAAPRAPARGPAPVMAKPNGSAGRPTVALARPAPRVAAPAPAEAPATGLDENDVATAAVNAASDALGATPNGTTKVLFRTGVYKSAAKAHGDEMGNAVLSAFFNNDENLNLLLGQLGYGVVGGSVKPLAQ